MKKMTKAESDRIEAVRKIGIESVEKNINKFLSDKDLLHPISHPYSFLIYSDSFVRQELKSSKFAYGYCDYKEKEIVLNVDHILYSNIADIIDTLLHEIAHAVAWHVYGDSGHGKNWKAVSRMFGSTPKATSKISDPALAAKHATIHKYAVVYVNKKDRKIERVGGCSRRLKNLGEKWANNDTDTIGNLWLLKTEDYNTISSFGAIIKLAFR